MIKATKFGLESLIKTHNNHIVLTSIGKARNCLNVSSHGPGLGNQLVNQGTVAATIKGNGSKRLGTNKQKIKSTTVSIILADDIRIKLCFILIISKFGAGILYILEVIKEIIFYNNYL